MGVAGTDAALGSGASVGGAADGAGSLVDARRQANAVSVGSIAATAIVARRPSVMREGLLARGGHRKYHARPRMSSALTKTYEPNPLLRALYERFFDAIQVDEAWVQDVRRLAARGTVVYVLRNLNFIDFFALDHLTKRYGLPQVRFVNDLGLGVLAPMGKGWLNALVPARDVTPSDELRDALANGGSAMLFLKRPPGMMDVAAGTSRGRGLKEGDELMETLIGLQRARDRPILLVPQVFVWTNRPDTRGTHPLDGILGPREWPHPLRTAGQFLYNRKHVALKAGEPLDLQGYLGGAGNQSDDASVRQITYTMLRRLERERRIVTGPAEKPPDRVRHEIIRSPKLRGAIADLAGERTSDQVVVTTQALGMLRGLQATPDTATIKALEMLFDRVFHRIYAGIEYVGEDIARLREATAEGAVILLPSHKSHIDYLILSYVFMQENLSLPLIAAGDNLSFFPLGAVFRRGGAFFIRRSFKGDALYSAVVDAYIRRLVRDGHSIEFFLEGGRSRNGKLLPPKFGLLGMVVEAALAVPHRKVFFAPISIGYERVVEASSYRTELSGGEKRAEDAAGLLKTTEVLRHRYGRINLQVGQLLTFDQILAELDVDPAARLKPAKRRALVTRLGNRVMDEINRVTAVTPGALTALAILSITRRGIPHEDLVDRCRRLLGVLHEAGARVTPTTQTVTGSLRPEAIREAIQMFIDAGFVQAHAPADTEASRSRIRRGKVSGGPGAIYTIPNDRRHELDTSKNIIIHFFLERCLVATAVSMPPGPPAALGTVKDRVLKLSRLFKFEFRFQADRPFDAIFDHTLADMTRGGELEVSVGEHLVAGPGRDGWSGAEWLEAYVSLLRNFIEGYQVAARGLGALLKGPLAEKEVVKRALAVGNRMFLAGEIERQESVSRPLVQNAIQSFVEQGYVVVRDKKAELAESFRSAAAVRAIEGRIAGYLEQERLP